MPSIFTRRKNHGRRPRSGQFDAQRLKQYLNENQQQATPHSEELEPEAEGGRSPAALIVDSSGSGSSSSSSSSSSNSSSNSSSSAGNLSMRTGDHGHGLPQRHNRVVSLSWPGREPHEPPLRWGEPEEPESRRIAGIIGPRGMQDPEEEEAGAAGAAEQQQPPPPPAERAAVEAPAHAAAAAAAAAAPTAPSKRQRQMDWANNTKASSGPIDIPLSPGDQQRGALPSTYHQDSLLHHAVLTTGEEDYGASGRGGRAATDAGAWYPCWPRTRPDEDSSGDGAGPPAHILIWERSFMRSASLQQRAMVMDEPLEGLLGGRRVSEGSTGRGQVLGEEEEEEEDDDDGCPERRMSDQSIFEMEF